MKEWSLIKTLNKSRFGDKVFLVTFGFGDKTIGVAVGEEMQFFARFTEDDDNPDAGENSTSHTVTEEDLVNGFTVSMDVYVTENGGRNSGQSDHFVVTYSFTPYEFN